MTVSSATFQLWLRGPEDRADEPGLGSLKFGRGALRAAAGWKRKTRPALRGAAAFKLFSLHLCNQAHPVALRSDFTLLLFYSIQM